jgi:hypothetical protein
MWTDRPLFVHVADPGEFRPVELYFRAPGQLVEVHRRAERAECETVRLRHAVNIVRRDHPSGSGHVLHDEVGISRNVLTHVLGEDACPKIVGVAGQIADDDSNGFSLIEGRLSRHGGDRRQQQQERTCEAFQSTLQTAWNQDFGLIVRAQNLARIIRRDERSCQGATRQSKKVET